MSPVLDRAHPCGGRRARRGARGWYVCLLLTAAVTVPTCAPDPEAGRVGSSPSGVVRAFLGELGRHDAEGALALLHEDFTFRSADGSVLADRRAMRTILAWDAAAEGRVEIRELREEGEVVRARLRETNRFTELLELDPWLVEATFVVRDGRIVEEVVREIVDEGPTFTRRFEAALGPIVRWAEENRPADARALFEDGRLARYDGPTARRLLRVIEAYLEEREGP